MTTRVVGVLVASDRPATALAVIADTRRAWRSAGATLDEHVRAESRLFHSSSETETGQGRLRGLVKRPRIQAETQGTAGHHDLEFAPTGASDGLEECAHRSRRVNARRVPTLRTSCGHVATRARGVSLVETGHVDSAEANLPRPSMSALSACIIAVSAVGATSTAPTPRNHLSPVRRFPTPAYSDTRTRITK